MSSNIRIQRICEFCNREFTAKTTVTKYCGDNCAKKAYKARRRDLKIKESDILTFNRKAQPTLLLQAKEFLTPREAATLLSCSVRSIYYYIKKGIIKAGNPSRRMTRIRRSEINRLF